MAKEDSAHNTFFFCFFCTLSRRISANGRDESERSPAWYLPLFALRWLFHREDYNIGTKTNFFESAKFYFAMVETARPLILRTNGNGYAEKRTVRAYLVLNTAPCKRNNHPSVRVCFCSGQTGQCWRATQRLPRLIRWSGGQEVRRFACHR